MDQGRHIGLKLLLAVSLLSACATAGGSSWGGGEPGRQVGATVPEIKVESLAGK